MCVVDIGMAMSVTLVPQTHGWMAKPSSRPCRNSVVLAEHVHSHSPPPELWAQVHGLKIVPLQRKIASTKISYSCLLFQLNIVTLLPSSASHVQHRHLPVQLYMINTLSFQCTAASQLESLGHLILYILCLCVCLSFPHFLITPR